MSFDLFSWMSIQLNQATPAQRNNFLTTLGARIFSEANDIKRTRKALARELNWDEEQVTAVFNGQARVEEALDLLSQMIQNYPLSLNDLWLNLPLDQASHWVNAEQSKSTSRIFNRPNAHGELTPYYEYRDTAMAPQAPFRPEWISQLRWVDNTDPEHPDVVYNKGHLMNQFTFFIGEVNFYWEDQGKRYCREMNTGDSCHITPFVPHTFTSRNTEQHGLIIAVTYGDNLRRANNHLSMDGQSSVSYLGRVFEQTAPECKVHSPFNFALRLHLDADLKTPDQLAETAGLSLDRLNELLVQAAPKLDEVKRLAEAFNLRPEDIYQPIDAKAVEFAMVKDQSWFESTEFGLRHKDLARAESQPGMKSFLLEVSQANRHKVLQHAYHQYVYNFSDQPVCVTLGDPDAGDKSQTRVLSPSSSCYLQPHLAHAFHLTSDADYQTKVQIIIVRLAAHFNQATINELAQINQFGRQRLLNETSQWF